MKNHDLRLVKNQSENLREHSLAQELPYWDLEASEGQEWVSLLDGTLVQGLKLQGVSTETSDANAVNTLTMGLRSFLNSLPDGMELQFLVEVNSDFADVIREHESLSGENELIKWVSKARTERLWADAKYGSLHKSNLYLFVYERPQVKTSLVTSFFQKAKRFHSIKRSEHEKRLHELSQKVGSIRENLERVGVHSTLMQSGEMQTYIYRFLNPERSKDVSTPVMSQSHREQEFKPYELAQVPELSIPSPREQMVFSDLIQSLDSFALDGLHHRMVTLKTLPEMTHSALISKIVNLPIHYYLSIQIKVPEQSKEISSIQSKRRMAHSMSASQGGRASDLESEARLQSTEELLRELLSTGQKIFYFQLAFLIQDPSKEGLEQKTKTILSKIRELSGAEGLSETVANFKVYKTILPAGNTTSVRPKRIKSDNLADFLPVYQPFQGLSRAVCLFRNRLSGLIKYDPFDQSLPNYNTLVTGSSGSGKSFLNNCILLQFLTQNPLVYIIDIGGSYRKLCEFMGGQYIEVSPPIGNEVGSSINPFTLPDGVVSPSPQKIKFLLSLLETMLSEEETDKLPKLSKSLLEEVIIQTYENCGSETPTLSKFVEALQASGEVDLKNYAKMLYPWTGNRPYGRLLDGKGALTLSADFVVFDLKSLSSYPDLQSVMILIITDFILGKVESVKDRKKQILMDECWELLKSRSASQFMEYCARTLRKTGSGICFITQGLEEILQSPIGAAILNNTATKFILVQRGDLEPTRKILKMNDQEMALISSLRQAKGKYSEAFMVANEAKSVIRIIPTPIEYWLATSDATDNALMENARKRFPEKSLPDVLHYLAIHYPHGSMGTSELKEAG
jgi:type-IV secretion system protein TraC